MSTWIYIQTEAVPLLALLVILYHFISRDSVILKNRRFLILVILIISIMVVDTLNWYVNGDPGRYPLWFLWGINSLYFLLTEAIAFCWFLYVFYRINGNVLSRRQKQFMHLMLIPLFIICGIIICSPINHLVFYIEPQTGIYHRGAAHLIQVAGGFGFMAVASILAYARSRKMPLVEQQKEYQFLSLVVVLPLAGGILQLFDYYLVCLWPFTTAAVFLMYSDFQGHQISMDALTNLNNRGNLEKYLLQRTQKAETGWYLIMVDVDFFKQINDKYGHIEGDRALQIIADTLKVIFGSSKSFISRYGGDEFAVIADYDSDNELEKTIGQCRAYLEQKGQKEKLPYTIQLSVGYARFESRDTMSMQKLVEMADEKMYEQKASHKRA